MQLFQKSNFTSYALLLGLLVSINPFSSQATLTKFDFHWPDTITTKKVIGVTLVALTLAALWTYYTKKETPQKRSLETCDGLHDLGCYLWNDVIVGSEWHDERVNSVEIDPENPTHLILKYEEKPATGLMGNAHYYFKKIIIPTMTFVVIFNAFKTDIMKALTEWVVIAADPANLMAVAKEVGK